MEFKVGDRFKCISDDLIFFDVGEIYQMKEIDSNIYCLSALNNQYMYVSPSFLNKNFEKVEEEEKPDLRDLLKVGYMYTTTDYKYVISNLYNLHFAKEKRDKNLKGLGIWKDIIAIHKPKYNGVKPMEWELVWERKEPKYYLRLPIKGNPAISYLNYDENLGNFNFASETETYFWKTQFTQNEINSLPNQDFIKTLVKEKVE